MFLLPTLNRIDKLKSFLKSAVTAGTTEPCLILVDSNDYLANTEAYIEVETNWAPREWKLKITDAVSMGDKIREVFPLIENKEWVGILNDDFEVVSKDWDKKLIAHLDGKNYVSANDRSLRTFSMPVTATAWSMPLLKALGWPIYPPSLQHLFIDDCWRDLGKATGCWRIAADCVVLHKHVMFGAAQSDSTHEKVYNQKAWDHDQAIYQNFLKHDFQAAVKTIQDFQNYLPGQKFTPDHMRTRGSANV
jgi:hypothetical protein